LQEEHLVWKYYKTQILSPGFLGTLVPFPSHDCFQAILSFLSFMLSYTCVDCPVLLLQQTWTLLDNFQCVCFHHIESLSQLDLRGFMNREPAASGFGVLSFIQLFKSAYLAILLLIITAFSLVISCLAAFNSCSRCPILSSCCTACFWYYMTNDPVACFGLSG
jgi:hypothetical protein